jgi:hypothetical protein
MLGDVQFTGRLAEPRDDQDQRREGPRHALFPARQQTLQERIELPSLHQLQGQPGAAELPAVLHAHARAIDLHEPRRSTLLREQFLLPILRRRWVRGLLHSQTAGFVHQPQIGHRALPRTALGAIRLDQRPICFPLAVASAVVRSQEHGIRLTTLGGKFFRYTPISRKYLSHLPLPRHRITTYVKIKLKKSRRTAIFSRRWGSWANWTCRRA